MKSVVTLTQRLDLKQTQSLVMTPQMQLAIKLLQLSHIELNDLVDSMVAENPLLEKIEGGVREFAIDTSNDNGGATNPSGEPAPLDQIDIFTNDMEGTSYGLLDDSAAVSPGQSASQLDDGTDLGDLSDFGREDRLQLKEDFGAALGSDSQNNASDNASDNASESGATDRFDGDWNTAAPLGSGKGSESGDYSDDINADLAHPKSLADTILSQIDEVITDRQERLIAHNLLDLLEPTGYLTENAIDEVATRLAIVTVQVESVLTKLQQFDPAGVFARSLAECLKFQLIDQNRFDPLMEKLLANLPLVAERNFKTLEKICGVNREELDEMLHELRSLDPKPGLRFSGEMIVTIIPDLMMTNSADGIGWRIELNPQTLPKLLINHQFVREISRIKVKGENHGESETRAYVSERLNAANWLVKALEQRATTLLKVASTIVKQQDRFFVDGPQYLRPMVLREVAELTQLHESTISRVTTNKFMATPRGLYELKYFFSASLSAIGNGDAHSAEAVRFRIKSMVDEEDKSDSLSDDQIVAVLRSQGIIVARRTVAKYREAMKIPSSVERRRSSGR